MADHIRQQIAASRLHGEGYRKLWARLRFAGVRASPRRVRRVMGENGRTIGTIVTNKVWGTDMTQTITVAEGRAYVFVVVEHPNSEVVGIHAARSANRFDEVLEPVRQGVHRCFLREATPATVHSLDGIEQPHLCLGKRGRLECQQDCVRLLLLKWMWTDDNGFDR